MNLRRASLQMKATKQYSLGVASIRSGANLSFPNDSRVCTQLQSVSEHRACQLLLPPTVDRIEAGATAPTNFVSTSVGNSGKGGSQYRRLGAPGPPVDSLHLALEPPFLISAQSRDYLNVFCLKYNSQLQLKYTFQ